MTCHHTTLFGTPLKPAPIQGLAVENRVFGRGTVELRSPRLLLPIVKREPEKTKVTVSLPQDVHADPLAYQRAYQEMNGAEVSLDFIIEQVLVHHLKRDKAFQTWKTVKPKTGEQT